MEPSEFQAWLGGGNASVPRGRGRKRFEGLAVHCHPRDDALALGPQLKGTVWPAVRLHTATTVVADEIVLRESIVNPQAKS